MALAYHVFGPCSIEVGTGANSALEVLGYTEHGGEIFHNTHFTPRHTDVSGPESPAVFQQFGEDMRIRVAMPVLDQSILDKVLIILAGDATTPAAGEQPTPGLIVGTLYTFPVAFRPPNGSAESPWYWPKAIFRGPHQRREGSEMTYPVMEFFAWVALNATETTRKDKILYQRTIP